MKETNLENMNNQKGFASIFLILGLAGLAYYIHFGMNELNDILSNNNYRMSMGDFQVDLNQGSFTNINYLVITLLSALTFISFIFTLRNLYLFIKLPTQRTIKKVCKSNHNLIKTSKNLLSEYRSAMFKHHTLISSRAQNCLSVARCIIASLEARTTEIECELSLRTSNGHYNAATLLKENLDLRGNSLNNIVYDPDEYKDIPELTISSCRSVLEELFNVIYEEIKIAIAIHETHIFEEEQKIEKNNPIKCELSKVAAMMKNPS